LPYPETVPEGIVDLLIQIGSRNEMLDRVRQALRRLDSINRLWREKWESIAKSLAQEDCKCLIHGLVIVERELEWAGGSASGAIWVFRVYEERFTPSHIEIANWVLQNRGRNPYLPFGGQSYAHNYDGYLAERQAARQRYQGHLDRQGEQQEEKKRKEKERHEKFVARLEEGRERAIRVREFNTELAALSVPERLKVIANTDMQLEAVANNLLVEAPNAATSIDPKVRSKLVQRIDRRSRGNWSRVKRALT